MKMQRPKRHCKNHIYINLHSKMHNLFTSAGFEVLCLDFEYCRCCVCLGEFKIKEELQLLPSCKHFFHTDCIRHWLHSKLTCPICRCSVIISNKCSSNSEQHSFSRDNCTEEGSSRTASSADSVIISIQTHDTS